MVNKLIILINGIIIAKQAISLALLSNVNLIQTGGSTSLEQPLTAAK